MRTHTDYDDNFLAGVSIKMGARNMYRDGGEGRRKGGVEGHVQGVEEN